MPLTATEQDRLAELRSKHGTATQQVEPTQSPQSNLTPGEQSRLARLRIKHRENPAFDEDVLDFARRHPEQFFEGGLIPEEVKRKQGPLQTLTEEFQPLEVTKKIPILGGVFGAVEATGTVMAAKRLKTNDYGQPDPSGKPVFAGGGPVRHTRENDEAIVADAINDATKQLTTGGKIAKGVSILPTWMLEFAATGGLASLGDDAARKAGEKLLGKYVKTTAGKAALTTAGLTAGAVVRSSTGLLPRVVEKAVDRQALVEIGISGEEGWATSFTKAWGDTVIESISEETGELLTGGFGRLAKKLPLGKKLVDSLRKGWMSKTGGTADDFAKMALTKMGYSNILGEIGEERIGTILREATGISDADREGNVFQRIGEALLEDIQPENLIVEAATLAVPASVRKAAGLVFRDKTTYSRKDFKELFGIDKSSATERQAKFDEDKTAFEAEQAEPAQAPETPAVAPAVVEQETPAPAEIVTEAVVEAEPEPVAPIAEPKKKKGRRFTAEQRAEVLARQKAAAPVVEKPAEQAKPAVKPAKIEKVAPNPTKVPKGKIKAKPAAKEAVQPTVVPAITSELLQAGAKSVKELRKEVENPRLGPVEGDKGTILFEFQGKTYQAPEPTDIAFGVNKEADTRVALKSVLDKTAKVVKKPAPAKKGKVEPEPKAEAAKDDAHFISLLEDEKNRLRAEKAEFKGDTVAGEPTVDVKDIDKRIRAINKDLAFREKRTKEAKDFGTKNTVVTKEKFDAAKKRQTEAEPLKGKRKKGQRKGAARVVTAQDIKDAVVIGGFYFEGGIREFGAWSKKVVADLGDWVKPHLESVWAQAKDEVEAFEAEPAVEPKKAVATTKVAKATPKVAPKKPGKVESKSVVARQLKDILVGHGESLELGYDPINIEEEVAKAQALVESDQNEAKRIAYSTQQQDNLLNNAVRLAYAAKMQADQNWEEMARISNWIRVENTRLGQEIVVNKGFLTENSPLKFVQQLQQARSEQAATRLGKGTKKQKSKKLADRVKAEVSKAKKKTESVKMNIANAQAFIESLRC